MNGQGTELEVVISYHPPAGEIGAGIAKLLNPVFERIVREDVMNFKDYIETKHNAKPGTNYSTGSNLGSESKPSMSTQGQNNNWQNEGV